jgi:CHASE3 domain sensor protein
VLLEAAVHRVTGAGAVIIGLVILALILVGIVSIIYFAVRGTKRAVDHVADRHHHHGTTA